MRINDFDIYQNLLMEKSGLSLTQDKSYLLDSRLTPVSKKWGFPSLDAMTMALQGVPDPNLVKDVIESMTTNETSFFRDTRPFDAFRDHVLPALLEKRAIQKRIRIWCAASSTGQEPYSLAMLIKEQDAKLAGWHFEIIGTDISTEVIEKAQKAEYTQFEVQRGLPIQMLLKYFEQNNEKWALKPEIKNMVKYRYFNLLDPLTPLGKFDIIFCRNVLIYFDKPTKKAVLEKMYDLLPPDGFLFLGGSETVLGITESYTLAPDLRGIYSKNETAPARVGKALAT